MALLKCVLRACGLQARGTGHVALPGSLYLCALPEKWAWLFKRSSNFSFSHSNLHRLAVRKVHCPKYTKMGDSWMLRPDYAEFIKTYNAVGASISTVFLFTRLWARTTQYKGLWWDDYFRKSVADTSHIHRSHMS